MERTSWGIYRLNSASTASLLMSIIILVSISDIKSEENCNEVYRQIYATSGIALSTEETYQKLLKLSELKPEDGHKGANWDILDALLDASENVSRERCTQEYFSFLNLLVKYTSYYTLNLSPYLKEARRRQFELCQDEFVFGIENLVSSFVDLNLNDIENLKKNILAKVGQVVVSSSDLSNLISDKVIHEGVLSYLQQKGSQAIFCKDNNENNANFLNEEIMKNVGRHCFMIQGIFYDSLLVTIKGLIENDDGQLDQIMHPVIKKWLTNSIICSKIIDNMPTLTDGVYNLLTEEKRTETHYEGRRFARCLPIWWNSEN